MPHAFWLHCIAASVLWGTATSSILRGSRSVRLDSRLSGPDAPGVQSNATGVVVSIAANSNSSRQRSFDDELKPATEEDMCGVLVQYAAQPSLCPVGHDRFALPSLQAAVPGFLSVWKAMKAAFPVQCCMGVNHLFAVYHAVSTLKPPVIIESGVAAGHTTWLLRRIQPAARIFSVDPGDPLVSYPGVTGVYGFRDPSPATTYLTGPAFQDLSQARWDLLIPDPAMRARTFVLLDDHQSTVERVVMLQRWGFRYIFYEDNYPFSVATSADSMTCPLIQLPRTYSSVMIGDAYSPNAMCAPVPAGTTQVLHKDRFGKLCKFITLPEHAANLAYFQSAIKSYYEYPALFSPCVGLHREPILGHDVNTLAARGLPLPKKELWRYGHLHPPLIELKPVAPAAAAGQLAAAIAAADAFALRVAQGQQVI